MITYGNALFGLLEEYEITIESLAIEAGLTLDPLMMKLRGFSLMEDGMDLLSLKESLIVLVSLKLHLEDSMGALQITQICNNIGATLGSAWVSSRKQEAAFKIKRDMFRYNALRKQRANI